METMLWVVLVVALAMAIGLALFARRLLRRDHQRTDARAALLRQMAFEPEAPPEAPDVAPHGAPHGADLLRAMPAPDWAAVPHHSPMRSRGWVPALVGLVLLVIGAGAAYGLYGPGIVEARAPSLPLDLLSLSHRVDAGDLVVTGLIQNPRGGRPTPRVMAVVYVFNAQGEYTASGKAALDFVPLAPGAESPFVVRIPRVAGVTRFRIGFRADDGSVIAHVDRRGQPIDGTTAGTPLIGEGQ